MTDTTQEFPDDLVILATLSGGKIALERAPSTGKYYGKVKFDSATQEITIPKVPSPDVVDISFHLKPGDTSGGFAGIKVWPVGRETPNDWRKSSGATTAIPDTVLNLHTYHSGDKCTILSLQDDASAKSTYNYCLGMHETSPTGRVVPDDPKIYNTGDPSGEPYPKPAGGLWARLRAYLGFPA